MDLYMSTDKKDENIVPRFGVVWILYLKIETRIYETG